MLKKAQGYDADGNVVEMWYVGDLNISNIDPTDEHSITTIDTNNQTDRVEFIGAGVKK